MQYSKSKSPRGTAFHLQDGENAVTAHVVTFPDAVPFAPQFSALASPVENFGAYVVDNLDQRLKRDARTDEARRAIPSIAAAVRSAINAVQAERRAIAAADAMLLAVEPGNSALRSEIRADWRSQVMDVQAGRVATASHDELAALIEGGQSVSRLPDAVWREIETRYVLLNHVKRSGLQADFQRAPTLTDITATGPDEVAAIRAAELSLEQHEARRATVEEAEHSLRSIVPFVALATDEQPQQALERLLT